MDDTDGHLREAPLDSTRVFDGHFLHVNRDTVKLPDGAHTSREYVIHPGAVMLIPLRDDGLVVLERQWRHPLGRVFVEFPAGKIDAGESFLATAHRELLEETGYVARQMDHLATIHNAISYSNEHIEIYLARGLTLEKAQLDQGEFLEVITARPQQLLDWVRDGSITDVKTIIGAFWLEKILAKQWVAPEPV